MANSKVLVLMILMIFFTVAAEGVQVSIGSMLASTMSVHCLEGHHDERVRALEPMKELAFDLSVEFHGPYVCGFDADGKKTTMFDVVHSRCNCDTYNGCAWVAQNDGFYCNHDFMRTWA